MLQKWLDCGGIINQQKWFIVNGFLLKRLMKKLMFFCDPVISKKKCFPFINHFREGAYFIYYPFTNRFSTKVLQPLLPSWWKASLAPRAF